MENADPSCSQLDHLAVLQRLIGFEPGDIRVIRVEAKRGPQRIGYLPRRTDVVLVSVSGEDRSNA